MSRRREDDLPELEDPQAALPPPRKKRPKGGRPASPGCSLSAIVGGMLFVMAIAGFAWFLTHQQQLSSLPTFPLPGFAPINPPTVQVPPLLAAGITLGHPTQAPGLNQQQALVIAGQLEPDAAAMAQNTNAQYVLLTYSGTGTGGATPAAQHDLNHVPAWMILYQNIPLQPSDPSVDPTPFPQSHHDLYVFLDANTGKELLAIWV